MTFLEIKLKMFREFKKEEENIYLKKSLSSVSYV